ncbi:protein O-glucosyltransferase 2-like isoform X1 [Mytilus californianus]|uniref:protein O-glucosyltransferase 2-like isoform X1 n=2 Tax=Mytilus californianus TaxID=6549 RepID=UPI002245D66C|nr:protein O-glucosyltransferase 2-like isoform X1 [Mytilus californianus]
MKVMTKFVLSHIWLPILIYFDYKFIYASSAFEQNVDTEKTFIYGPGLDKKITLPVRYFYIQPVDTNNHNITRSIGDKAFDVTITQVNGNRARVWVQILDLQDGSYIVRYRLYESYPDIIINVKYNEHNVARSPYNLSGMVYHEKCNCPVNRIEKWFEVMGCPESYNQIDDDLSIFDNVDLEKVAEEAVSRFSNRGMHSLSHYRIINNQIYRKTYGEHVGFKMFSDSVLLSLTRKVVLPDVEFFVNLGDWPLEKKDKKDNPLPIFSWCGSDLTRDIVMPTYDITEATIEMMSRVSLDVFSVQGNTGPQWENKTAKAFWRGRDSRQERLDLVVLSRKQPKIIDAALTHMFFFPKDPEKYGELVKTISFFDFFKYKYQINMDGTVAAYRFPYLLAGDAVVFKHESEYYEHFYHDLQPYVHYIPYKKDLSDLVKQIEWAKNHEEEVLKIVSNARSFVRENLLPKDIYCYHAKVFNKFSKLLKYKPKLPDSSWESVEQPTDNDATCDCKRSTKSKTKEKKDEL